MQNRIPSPTALPGCGSLLSPVLRPWALLAWMVLGCTASHAQEGGFITECKQFSRPSGIAIRDGLIYVADSESNGVAPNPGWKRGIRVGRVSDGAELYRIPDQLELKGTSAAEGVAVDARGNVFGAEVGPRQLVKHAKP